MSFFVDRRIKAHPPKRGMCFFCRNYLLKKFQRAAGHIVTLVRVYITKLDPA